MGEFFDWLDRFAHDAFLILACVVAATAASLALAWLLCALYDWASDLDD